MSIDDFAVSRIVEGRNLPWLLQTQARRMPKKTFLVWAPFENEHRAWTYAEFEADVRRVASGLVAQGLKPGQRLLIHLENCPELLLSWFACAYVGAVGVLSNTRSTTSDLSYFCRMTDAVGVVTQPQFAQMISTAAPDISFVAVTQTDAGGAAGRDLDWSRAIAFEQLIQSSAWDEDVPLAPMEDLCVLFTSGTTSRAKAVVWTHANVLFAAQQHSHIYALRQDDICQVTLPLYHVYALSCGLMGSLWAGGAVILQRKFSARNFWGAALKYGATWAPMVPFCVNALLEREVPDHRFRFWQYGVAPDVEKKFRLKTTSQWGMTEMGWLPIASDMYQQSAPLSIGRPIPGILISVRRADGDECAVGEAGDLYVKGVPGVTMFRTYLNNPKAYVASFDKEGWFNTGDRVRIGEDGDLFFADRVKDVVRVGGENVSAAEIEQVIMATGWVKECAVVAGPDEMLDEVPIAFVIAATEAPTDLKNRLIEFSRLELADFKVIRDVHIVNKLPYSTIGKIAKNELRQRLRVAL